MRDYTQDPLYPLLVAKLNGNEDTARQLIEQLVNVYDKGYQEAVDNAIYLIRRGVPMHKLYDALLELKKV